MSWLLGVGYFLCALLLAWLDMQYLEAWDAKQPVRAAVVDFCKTGLSGLFIVMLVLEQWWVLPVDCVANAVASYFGVRRRCEVQNS